MSLIVTGSIGIDTIITPISRADRVLGGSCVYFAAAASFFGPVRMVGAIGDDFPEVHLEIFEHFQLDTAGLERRTGSKTFSWTGQYMENMNERETLSVELNVLAEALPEVPAAYQDSRYVFLANTSPIGQLELLAQFPSPELVVADTMDLWIATEPQALRELLGKIHGLVLNDQEAKQLTGKGNLMLAAEKILEMGPQFVVIKKGEHGCMLLHEKGLALLPAYPTTEVVDPTGAGDTFAGGMMGYLASTGHHGLPELRRAMAYGTVVASYTVENFSLQRLKQLERHDLDQRLEEFASYIRLA